MDYLNPFHGNYLNHAVTMIYLIQHSDWIFIASEEYSGWPSLGFGIVAEEDFQAIRRISDCLPIPGLQPQIRQCRLR